MFSAFDNKTPTETIIVAISRWKQYDKGDLKVSMYKLRIYFSNCFSCVADVSSVCSDEGLTLPNVSYTPNLSGKKTYHIKTHIQFTHQGRKKYFLTKHWCRHLY